MVINLLQETIERLERNGKSPADVEWVGIKDATYYSWADFKKQAKHISYDNGFGRAEIAADLVVVGKDFWLEREEYDGSEWWNFKIFPTRPINKSNELKILDYHVCTY